MDGCCMFFFVFLFVFFILRSWGECRAFRQVDREIGR